MKDHPWVFPKPKLENLANKINLTVEQIYKWWYDHNKNVQGKNRTETTVDFYEVEDVYSTQPSNNLNQ